MLLVAAEELADLGTWWMNPATGETEWSDGVFRIFGLEPGPSSPAPRRFMERIHPDDKERIQEVWDRAAKRPGLADGLRRAGGLPDRPPRRAGARDPRARPHRAPRRRLVPLARPSSRTSPTSACPSASCSPTTHVAQALREWESFEEGVVVLLRRMATALDFPTAALWIVGRARRRSSSAGRCGAGRTSSGASGKRRRGRCASGPARACRAGRGRRSEPVSSPDVDERPGLPARRGRRARSGITSALLFPAVSTERTRSPSLAFYSLERREPSDAPAADAERHRRASSAGFLARRRGQLEPVAAVGARARGPPARGRGAERPADRRAARRQPVDDQDPLREHLREARRRRPRRRRRLRAAHRAHHASRGAARLQGCPRDVRIDDVRLSHGHGGLRADRARLGPARGLRPRAPAALGPGAARRQPRLVLGSDRGRRRRPPAAPGPRARQVDDVEDQGPGRGARRHGPDPDRPRQGRRRRARRARSRSCAPARASASSPRARAASARSCARAAASGGSPRRCPRPRSSASASSARPTSRCSRRVRRCASGSSGPAGGGLQPGETAGGAVGAPARRDPRRGADHASPAASAGASWRVHGRNQPVKTRITEPTTGVGRLRSWSTRRSSSSTSPTAPRCATSASTCRPPQLAAASYAARRDPHRAAPRPGAGDRRRPRAARADQRPRRAAGARRRGRQRAAAAHPRALHRAARRGRRVRRHAHRPRLAPRRRPRGAAVRRCAARARWPRCAPTRSPRSSARPRPPPAERPSNAGVDPARSCRIEERMTWYELLLFLHIVAAIIWLGSGLFIQILATRAERAGDAEGLRRVADDSAGLSETLFIPASLATLDLRRPARHRRARGASTCCGSSSGLAGYLGDVPHRRAGHEARARRSSRRSWSATAA